MAVLTVQQVTPAGLEPALVAAAGGGDKVRPGPTTFLEVLNSSGSDITVTLDDPRTPVPPGSAANNDAAIVVTAGERRLIGPLKADRFAAVADDLVAIAYSDVTTVTVGAFSV